MNTLRLRGSPCCGAKVEASLGDGVFIGSCSQCGGNVCRVNPRTGELEWLDGESPWTPRDDLRRMLREDHQRGQA